MREVRSRKGFLGNQRRGSHGNNLRFIWWIVFFRPGDVLLMIAGLGAGVTLNRA